MISEPTWQVHLGDYAAALALSPDGRRVAAGSLAGDAVIIDVATGDADKLTDHPFGVSCASWSPDGTRLATAGHDGVIHLYDADAQSVGCVDVDGWVAALAWSPDSQVLAAAAKRALTLIDRDGQTVHRYGDVSSTITAVAWATNGKRVGVTSYGGITWYDPDTLPNDTPSRTHLWKGSLLSLAIAPNGRWACAGAQDASIHLWRLWSGDDLSMSGYPSKIEYLAFRHDSHWMASACLGEITFWDFSGRGPKGTRPASGEAHDRHITALTWQPAANVLASGCADGRIALWPSPRKPGQQLTPSATTVDGSGISALVWHPAGSSLVASRADGTIEHRVIGSP